MSLQASPPLHREPHMIGRYEILCELGYGGMGTVYLGRLQSVGGFEKLVAVKVLHRHLASHAMVVDMLHTEARLAALIHHPNVVGMLDAGESESGEHYVVMEYVDGFTLGDVIERLKSDAPRRMRLGLRIVLDAAAGLEAAHRLLAPSDGKPLHLVHRDVSTENVLVSLQGSGRVSDFGVAHVAMRRRGSLPGVKGTPCYMAPEQARGIEPIDARADVFSLGAVLWEILTGKQLFDSPSGVVGVLERVLQGEIESPSASNPNVPAALDEVCLKALQRDPLLRYQSARELARDLERVACQHHILASTGEVSRAIHKMFAPQIERRRATIALATGRKSGERPALLRSTPPTVPEHAKRSSGLFAPRSTPKKPAARDSRPLALLPPPTAARPTGAASPFLESVEPAEDAMIITPQTWKSRRWQHVAALAFVPLLAWAGWTSLQPRTPSVTARAHAPASPGPRPVPLELVLPDAPSTSVPSAPHTDVAVDAVAADTAPITPTAAELESSAPRKGLDRAARRARVAEAQRSLPRAERSAPVRRERGSAAHDTATPVPLDARAPARASAPDGPPLEDNPYLIER